MAESSSDSRASVARVLERATEINAKMRDRLEPLEVERLDLILRDLNAAFVANDREASLAATHEFEKFTRRLMARLAMKVSKGAG